MKDDQYFSPGDKVTRVAYADALGIQVHYTTCHPETDFGHVLCVSEFIEDNSGNRIRFVGIPLRDPTELWFACCFRKVEELKLCVRAAQHFKKGVEVENFSSVN